MNYIVYDTKSGNIRAFSGCRDAKEFEQVVPPAGLTAMLLDKEITSANQLTHWVKDGQLVEYTAVQAATKLDKPRRHGGWDNGAMVWVPNHEETQLDSRHAAREILRGVTRSPVQYAGHAVDAGPDSLGAVLQKMRELELRMSMGSSAPGLLRWRLANNTQLGFRDAAAMLGWLRGLYLAVCDRNDAARLECWAANP